MNPNMEHVSFCHANVRSLCSTFELFSDFLLTERYDIIGLSETWLKEELSDDALAIPGYNLSRNDRWGRGGGVAFYVRDCYSFKNISVQPAQSALEQLWISVRIRGKSLCLGTLYRPDGNLISCIDDLENSLISLIPEYDVVIFGGDLNIDMLVDTPGERRLKNLFQKYSFHQIISEPTRVTDTSSKLLDVLVTNETNFVCEPEVVRIDDISDHRLVRCMLRAEMKRGQVKFRTYRDFKNFNEEAFHRDLGSFGWDYLYSLNNVNEMVDFFNKSVISLFNIHAPMKTSKITKNPAPWLTGNIRFMMRLRQKALSKYKKHKSDADWQSYKDLRNLVLTTIRNEKKAYLNFKFQSDPKNFWKTLKYLNINSRPESSPDKVGSVEDFGNFFVNAIPQSDPGNFYLTKYQGQRYSPSLNELNFREVNEEKIKKIILQIRSNATGDDGINLKMILLLIPYLTPHITFIINKCIQDKKVPDQWKVANVIPMAKRNNPLELKHFRPISILPTLSKILEKILYEQLFTHLEQNNILPPTQSGFRANHSTTTALLQVTDDVIQASDQGQCTCVVLLDYSKAFDTLIHKILLTKLGYYGLGPDAIAMMANYFNGRLQRVVFDGKFSTSSLQERGVPQGSVLGPLVFTLYTADFQNFLKYMSGHQFADDYQLQLSFDKTQVIDAKNQINEDLATIHRVSQQHGLILNATKTQAILFGSNRRQCFENGFKISIDQTDIEFSDCVKNLGVMIDYNLRYESHVSKLLQKSYGKLKMLYLHKDYLSTKVKLRLCDSLILSQLSYCDTLYWPALLKKDQESLQKFQNACLRFSYGVRKFDHISPYYVESGWLRLDKRFFLHMCTIVHKICMTHQPKYLDKKLIRGSDIHNRPTRHRGLCAVPRHKTALFCRCFRYVAAKCYNSISFEIKCSETIPTFKKSLKSFLKARNLKSIYIVP